MSAEQIVAIRRALADYMQSEGCGCCGSREEHKAATARLAKLLRVPMYADKSGYNFARYSRAAGEERP